MARVLTYIVGAIGAAGLFFATNALAADVLSVRNAMEYTIQHGTKTPIVSVHPQTQKETVTGSLHTLVLDGRQISYPKPSHIKSPDYSAEIILITISGKGVKKILSVKVREKYGGITEEHMMHDGDTPASTLDGKIDMAMHGKTPGGLNWIKKGDDNWNRTQAMYDKVVYGVDVLAEAHNSALAGSPY